MIELAIHKLERFTNIIEFVQSINMIFNNDIRQTTDKYDNVIDNTFKVVCGMNFQKRKKISSYNTRPNKNPTY